MKPRAGVNLARGLLHVASVSPRLPVGFSSPFFFRGGSEGWPQSMSAVRTDAGSWWYYSIECLLSGGMEYRAL
jgi:hypothetical protein